ncbi:MAG: cell wall-active antibiotics response protein [Chloroflexi bacterium]|nr:cell wall-active antibiotics response protein [Chloroflexota bacterium]
MAKRGEFYVGGLFVLIGIIALLGSLLRIPVGALIWSLLLIGVGVWLIVKPRVATERPITFRFLGDVKRRGPWALRDEEIWLIIGNLDLDLTQAEIPEGETCLRLFGFVGDVDITIPEGLAFCLRDVAFVSDAKILGGKQETFLAPITYATPEYEEAKRRVRVEAVHFVSDMTVRAG